MEKKEREEIIRKLVKGEGFELYAFRLYPGKKSVRLYIAIDHLERKIDLSDCERVSKRLGEYFDLENWFDFPYTLEVSSPGVERELKTAEDYRRFAGETVKIVLKEPLEKRSVFIGRLSKVSLEERRVEIVERDSTRAFTIGFDQIKKGNLYLEV